MAQISHTYMTRTEKNMTNDDIEVFFPSYIYKYITIPENVRVYKINAVQ